VTLVGTKENTVPSTKTHYPQVPVEVAQKIAEEQGGEIVEKETPEQLRGPTAKDTHGKSKPERDSDEVL